MIISLLTDFGLEDGWVASCKGQILKSAPEAKFLDISHGIPSFNIKKGALVLISTLPFLPVGIHLAIVDPGVGSKRKSVVVKVDRGDYLIGPDNGICAPVIEKLGGAKKVVEIDMLKRMRESVCPTFHGRDIFAPAAAFLFLGAKMEELGPAVDPTKLKPKPWKDPHFSTDRIVGEIIDIDKFGTLRSNIWGDKFNHIGNSKSDLIKCKWGTRTLQVPVVDTFSQVAKDQKLLLIDSTGLLSLAINCGNAAVQLNQRIGDQVVVYK